MSGGATLRLIAVSWTAAPEKNFRDPETKYAVGGVGLLKDRKEVMEDVVTHEEDWKVCFAELGPGLVLFARQFVRSIADAEDIVQDAFVRFWRKQHSAKDRGLLYAPVRSVPLDLPRRAARRARREATASA